LKRVVVVDYGVGNLLSVSRALTAAGGEVELSGSADRIRAAERVVLPGVGAFGDCMAELQRRDLVPALLAFIGTGRPMLGICVGMQILLEASEEFGEHAGLGVIHGRVTRIPDTGVNGLPHKVPHVGWNSLLPRPDAVAWHGTMFEGIVSGSPVYFVHSFTAEPLDARYRLADADYHGRTISAAVRMENVVGTQFHPEKSGGIGLKILENFLTLSR
jgi:glutamine amidotransferase